MRILFLDQFSDLGGAQLCLLDLLPAISDRGWQAWIAAPPGGPLLDRCAPFQTEQLNLGLYRSGPKSMGDALRFAWDMPTVGRQIAALIERHGIDLLYVNGPRLLPAAAWGRGRTPVLFHCHSYLSRPREAAIAARSLRRMNARVLANCRFVTRPLQPHIGTERIGVIYNGVRDCGSARLGHGDGPLRVGIIGRIAPEKGQAELLRAARILEHSGAACRYVVSGAPRMGDSASETYAEQTRALAEGLPVDWLGWSGDIAEVLAGLDLLVVPSAPNEATTRVIPEAFSAAVPVIATRTGGIPEIADHQQTGWLIDSNDPEALALTLGTVLRKPEGELRAMGIRARKTWQDRFRLDQWQSRVIAAIESAAAT